MRSFGLVALLTVVTSTGSGAAAEPLFAEVAAIDLAGYPESSRYFTLELSDVRALLEGAPVEDFADPRPGLTMSLPLPGGTSERFTIWESSILHPELAARYPDIKTYVGRGVDDRTATVRLDTTPAGFHALILSTRRTMLIDPVWRGETRTYVSYFKRGAAERGSSFSCELTAPSETVREIRELVDRRASQALRGTGTELRTYRTAIAATGEYTQFHGGTVSAGLAAITTSLNRVTGIYEREVSVRMELIPNNNLIVYTNGATDPYTNSSGGTMLGQNQSNLDSVIGSANYDIGHVFSTGGGGVAFLGVVCRTNQKARGVTGLNSPIGDTFDVDYVSHEMGHQYGGTHTFNGNAGSCSGNRTASTAYEPGSGSTIMGYAGICGSQNIVNFSQDDFHGASFDQISAYTQSGFGNNCPVTTATGNSPPVVVAGNVGHTIPIDTPFILFGSATDPDGDPFTYSWEEFDLGPAGAPDSPSGNAPIFRSFAPKNREWRMFPRKASVRNNTSELGEILPTYTRDLNFRLTVRDNLGGVGFDTTSLDVDGGSGPFLVTSIDALPWDPGTARTVTWDVAGTDVGPVSCSTVNILLSLDDGVNFTEVLAAGTPNDGSESIVVPSTPTLQARVQVEAVGNVFFDMNDDAFEVTDATGVDHFASSGDRLTLDVRPNPFSDRSTVAFSLARSGPVSVDVYDARGRRIVTVLDETRAAGPHTVEWNGRDATGFPAASGVYFVRVESREEAQTVRSVLLR